MLQNNIGNEPAFPDIVTDIEHHAKSGTTQPNTYSWGGLTKREYFAAKADIPWELVKEALSMSGNSSPSLEEVVKARVHMKYKEADLMLEASNG